MKPEEVVPLVVPLFHVYGVIVVNVTLYSGATVAVFDRFKPEALLKTIEEYKVEQLFLVPYLINFLGKTHLVERFDLSSVAQVWSGGSPLFDEDAKMVQTRYDEVLLPLHHVRHLFHCLDSY
jgi:acyl-coenzyme A synthetase/AMP-(fatty) acid ligase